MDKRLLALLIAAAISIYGCTRPAGGPVGNMSDSAYGADFQGPDWRS